MASIASWLTAAFLLGVLFAQSKAVTTPSPTGCCIKTTTVALALTGTGTGTTVTTCTTEDEDTCKPNPITSNPSFVQGGVCNGDQCSKATMTGDPVMQGFDGTTFEFFGTSGSNYSVFGTMDTAINMQLVPAGPEHIRHQGGEGTFVGGMAIVQPFFELIAHVDEVGNMTISADGVKADIEVPHSWGTVTYEPYVPDLGQTVTIEQASFKIVLVAVKQYTDEESGYNRGHFDMHAEINGPLESSVSGILGKTLGPMMGASLNEDEYQIPSLTSRSFTETHSPTSRRLLTAVDFSSAPLRAGIISRNHFDVHTHVV